MTFLLTFPDIAEALAAGRIFKREGMAYETCATPPELGLTCAYALRCDFPDEFELLRFLRSRDIKALRIVPDGL